MTAACSEVIVDDKTYRLAPLADRDWGEFERWTQDKYLHLARRNLEGMSPDEKAILLKEAWATASKITISSPESLNIMSTVDGAAYLLYLSLRREDSTVTFELAQNICTNPEVMGSFMDRIRELNGGDEVETEEVPLEKGKSPQE
jgi:hypothetical protein